MHARESIRAVLWMRIEISEEWTRWTLKSSVWKRRRRGMYTNSSGDFPDFRSCELNLMKSLQKREKDFITLTTALEGMMLRCWRNGWQWNWESGTITRFRAIWGCKCDQPRTQRPGATPRLRPRMPQPSLWLHARGRTEICRQFASCSSKSCFCLFRVRLLSQCQYYASVPKKQHDNIWRDVFFPLSTLKSSLEPCSRQKWSFHPLSTIKNEVVLEHNIFQ